MSKGTHKTPSRSLRIGYQNRHQTMSAETELLERRASVKPLADKLTPKELRLLFILAIVQFTHIVDFMIIMPLGADLMGIFDIDPRQFSWIVSSYAFTAFASGLLSAMFIDRFDRKKALFILYIGFTIGTLACSIAPNYNLFLAARMLTGAFGGVLAALILSIVADVIPLSRRGRAMGIVMTAFSAASVVGVPLGIYLSSIYSWRFPFLSTGILAAFVSVLIFFGVPKMIGHLRSDAPKAHPLQSFRNVLGDNNQLMALLFNVTLMLGHFTIIPFIAPYMEINIGFDKTAITLLYAIGGALTVVALPMFGRLSDQYGHARIFTIASFAAVFSIFAITNLPVVSIAIALIATSSYFIISSGRNVPALTMITSVVKPQNRGSFMSIRSSMSEASLALSSFIAGLIVTVDETERLVNYSYVGYIAIVMSLLAIILAWRIRAID